jgi:hypothetical protein
VYLSQSQASQAFCNPSMHRFELIHHFEEDNSVVEIIIWMMDMARNIKLL